MATVNKDFRVKHGLVVQGTNATVNASDIITEDAITGGTQTNISVTYNPTTKVVNFVAENGVADSNTDALTEGATNKYFTDERAQDAVAAAIAAGTHSNVTITYDDATNKLSFAAENGVADSNTDNLSEGSTNKYFTDERAQDAIGNAVGAGLSYNDTTGAISAKVDGYVVRSNGGLGGDTIFVAYGVGGGIRENNDGLAVDFNVVAGVTDYQTLTNKTLTSPKINEDVALTATATELNVLDGITSTTAELNILDGVTSTASELNILDGATLTVTELNYVDGVTSSIQNQLDGKLDESGGTMTGAIAMGTNKITGLGAPTSSTDAATKAYVDAVSEGLHVHESARVAVNGNITIATALENGDTAGGVTLATGDRVLLKDQTNTAENGIYVVQASGQALRAADFDTATEVDSGDFIFVSSGTYAGTGWVQTLRPATIGTDPIAFTQFSGAGTFTAGTGLDLNGTEFVLDLSEVSTTTLPEGDNKYYTDERVDDRVDGLLVGGTGISKTYNDNANSLTLALDFTEFSTTDVAEGTKLFFTNQRAVDALQAVVPDFTEIEVNNIARQVAATVSAPTAATAVTAFAFAKASYRSAKFLVKVAYGSHTEVSEVLLTLDTSDNIAITEYAVVGTNGSSSGISADIDGANVRLRVTPVNNSSTVRVMGTLLV
jgi:hypothetical protein